MTEIKADYARAYAVPACVAMETESDAVLCQSWDPANNTEVFSLSPEESI